MVSAVDNSRYKLHTLLPFIIVQLSCESGIDSLSGSGADADCKPPAAGSSGAAVTFGTLLLPYWAQVDESTCSAWRAVSISYAREALESLPKHCFVLCLALGDPGAHALLPFDLEIHLFQRPRRIGQ
jgi:hypothetical protein